MPAKSIEICFAFLLSVVVGTLTTNFVTGQAWRNLRIPLSHLASAALEQNAVANDAFMAPMPQVESVVRPIIDQEERDPGFIEQRASVSATKSPLSHRSTLDVEPPASAVHPRMSANVKRAGSRRAVVSHSAIPSALPNGTSSNRTDRLGKARTLTGSAGTSPSRFRSAMGTRGDRGKPVALDMNGRDVAQSQLSIPLTIEAAVQASSGDQEEQPSDLLDRPDFDAMPIDLSSTLLLIADVIDLQSIDPDVDADAKLSKKKQRGTEPVRVPVAPSVSSLKSSTAQSSSNKPRVTAIPSKILDPVEAAIPRVQSAILPVPPLRVTRQMAFLRPRITKTLRFYDGKPLNTKDDSAWSVMHSILGYGVNGTVAVNGKKGRRTNAVSWMCRNNPCANRRLLYLDAGYIKGVEGPGFQGHPGQFLAMLAQVNVRRDYPLHVQGQAFTLEDLVDAEMRSCSTQRELTFKLIGLSHYLQSAAEWKDEHGEDWNLQKILEIELAQPVSGAACGGIHRVMAISYAVRTKQRRGDVLEGAYLRAQKYIREYQRYALSLQNRDGSFSSDWFKRRSDWGDKDRQLQTTGHMLEWLVYSLPRNELSDPRIVRCVEFLTNLMTRHRHYDWEVGPRGHALRALALYQQRVFEHRSMATPVARLTVSVAK